MTNAVTPRVAVLLATHNGLPWLEAQVDSIFAQSGVEVTLLVSDDASDDGTDAWLVQRAATDSRLEILRHGHRFGSAAGNFFYLLREVDATRFDYYALADQDDLWRPDKLERAVAQMQAQRAEAYSGNVIAFWPDGRKRLIDKAQAQKPWDFLFEAAGPGCTYVFSGGLFRTIQQFVQGNSTALQGIHLHDWLLYAFARSGGFRWFIDSEATVYYRQHASNHVGVRNGWKALRGRLRNVQNGWWLSQARLIARLLRLEQDPFVRNWIEPKQRAGYGFLARSAGKCRRKRTDALFMAGLMLLLWVQNPVWHPPKKPCDLSG